MQAPYLSPSYLKFCSICIVVALIARADSQAPAVGSKPIVEHYANAMVSVVPASFGYDPFYKKYSDALGIPILSSAKVPDDALLMARDIVIYMLSKRPEFRDALIAKR